MNIKKLIRKLLDVANRWESGKQLLLEGTMRIQDELRIASAALSELQAKNVKLCAEAEHWKNSHHEAARNFQQKNRECRRLIVELEQAKAEKDAAIEDLRICSTECFMECQYCLYRTARSFCSECTDGSNWKWRGPRKED